MRTRIFRRSRRRSGHNQPFFQSMKGSGEYVAAESSFFAPSTVSVQPKLAIGQPGDKYEREADAMADRVVSQSSASVLSSSPPLPPAIQTMCADCAEEQGVQRQVGPLSLSPAQSSGDQGKLQRAMEEEEPEVQTQMSPLSPSPAPGFGDQGKLQRAEEEEEPAVQTQMDPLSPRLQRAMEEEPEVQTQPLMRKAAGGQSVGTTALASKLSASRGGGQPMAPQTNASMSQAFGRDFGQVRIHTGSEAVQMNQGLNAKAFTHGPEIYFNRGQYNPESTAGKRLLAHELTHVVQQNGDSLIPSSGNSPNIQRACGSAAIGQPSGCTFSSQNPEHPKYLFRVNCDEFRTGNELDLRADARRIQNGETIQVHGFASIDGDAGYNMHLSCARALLAKQVILDELSKLGRTANIQVFNHGGTLGDQDLQRSVVMLRMVPEPPEPEPEEPARTPDHFRVELKAWIPHRKVVDPEESVRASNLLDLWIGSIPGNPIDVEYTSHYRGDNHVSYGGGFRVLSVAEFDWDGAAISNFVQSGSYGTTHRDYRYEIFIDNIWPIPNIPLTSSSGTESDTATSATNGSRLSSNSFTIGLASANPVVMTWAPDIDSDLNGTINSVSGSQRLALDYNTDGFPSHGVRVFKNGAIVDTRIVNDASGKAVLGVVGMAVISQGLMSQSNSGTYSLPV